MKAKISIAFVLIFSIGVALGWLLKPQQEMPDFRKQELLNQLHQNRLIDSLVKTGDTILYEKLRWQYDMKIHDFMGIALVMANKHNYTNAYEDVFECIHDILKSGTNFDTLFNYSKYDEKTKKMALEYLEEAAKRGNNNAIEMRCKYDKSCNYENLIDSIMKKK